MAPAPATVIVTGANVGLGYACADRLAELRPEWTLVLACRNREKAEAAADRIRLRSGNPNLVVMDLDLASLESVRRFARQFAAAGVQFTGPTSYVDGGIETTFAVNHLGHFLLANLLLRTLVTPARIVFVASGTHDPKKKTGIPHPRYPSASQVAKPEADPGHANDDTATAGKRRYSTSKLCNVYCTYEMARRLEARGTAITVTAFDPGLMPGTDLARDYHPVLRFLWHHVLPQFTFLPGNIHSIRHSGHALADLAVDAEFEGVTGKYFEGRLAIPSSDLSYNQDNWTDLWNTSVELTQLTADDTPLPL